MRDVAERIQFNETARVWLRRPPRFGNAKHHDRSLSQVSNFFTDVFACGLDAV